MRLFVCSMPIIALVMIFNNYSYQWDTIEITGYDSRAKAIFNGMKARHRQSPQQDVVSLVLEDN